MRKHFQYILVGLSLIIVYLLYLIFSFKYVDIQKDIAINDINANIVKLKNSIEIKKENFAHINTLAYKDKIAKSSQNKKNPGEDVVFIVTKDEIDQYKKIDVQQQMYSEKSVRSATYGMSNWQKWVYYVFKEDVRD